MYVVFKKNVVRMGSRCRVTDLKEKLRELELSTSGTKAELLKRLHEADPGSEWLRGATEMVETGAACDESDDTEAQAADEREVEMSHREKELERQLQSAQREIELERKLQAVRRELKLLREAERPNTMNRPNTTNRPVERERISRDTEPSITAIAHLLSDFDGSTPVLVIIS